MSTACSGRSLEHAVFQSFSSSRWRSPALARLQIFDLACFENLHFSDSRIGEPCAALADVLDEVSQAAATLSDRLAMRYFTHVGDVGRQTLAA